MAVQRTTFLLIRHGETTWNAKRKLQGNADTKLTPKGRTQAKALARYLQDFPIHAIYSSPLTRTLFTAREINKFHKADVHTDVALLERGFGELEGRFYDDIYSQFPRFGWPEALLYPWYQPLGSERLIDVEARVARFLKAILAKHKNETVAIVSHGVTLRSMITYLIRAPRSFNYAYSMGNTSLTIVRVDEQGNAQLHKLASEDHLKDKNRSSR